MSQYGAEGFARHGWDYRRILSHYYRGTALARAQDGRVRVLVRDGQANLVVGARSAFRLTDAGGGTLQLGPGRYALTPELVLAAGRRYLLRPPVRFDPGTTPLLLDDDAYRGSLLVGRGGSGLYAVDDVQVDDYVRGVVAWEMPSQWHQQALRVQAVAARSYALAERKPGHPYDLFADTRSQMYGGIRAETAETDRAVAATRGEVVTWRGQIAIAFYSSSSGGCTAALSDGMPGAQRLPYLRSVADPYDAISPSHAWGPVTVSSERLSGLFGLSAISSLRVNRNPSGRVTTVVGSSADGERAVSASAFASALGLRSTWFEVGSSGRTNSDGGCSEFGKAAPLPPAAPTYARAIVRSVATAVVEQPAAVRASAYASPSPGPHRVGLPSRSALLLALAAALVLLGVLDFARGDRRVLALCAAGVVIAVCVDRWPADPRSRTALPATSKPEPARAAPSAHDGPRPTSPSPAPAEPEPPAVSSPSRPGTPVPTPPAPAPAAPRVVTPALEPATTALSARGDEQAPAWLSVPGRKGGELPPAGPSPTPPEPSLPAPSEALTISDVHVEPVAATRTLSVSWRTSVPASTVGAAASGAQATVWTPADAGGTDHESVYADLAPDTRYELSLHAVDGWGREQATAVEVVTPPRGKAPTAGSSGGALLVDGQPFFPIALWALCSSEVDTKLAQGFNLFMTNGCGKDASLVSAVGARALTVTNPATAAEGRGGPIGWNYPDEWDNWLPSDVTPAMLGAKPPLTTRPLLSFLTLTNHFYSYADPLPQGRGMYPLLAQTADVLGFDLYPMQVWCNADAFAHVFEAQRELVQLAAGKPTYQWIEAAPMEHCPQPELAPTPQTVRAETWLAIAGGAAGIGYFPNGWTDEIGGEIERTNRQISELAPALLAPRADVASDQPSVMVSARLLHGALYVIAVNSSRSAVTATLTVPQLFANSLDVYDEHRQVQAANGILADTFEPLQVHVYIAAPLLARQAPQIPPATNAYLDLTPGGDSDAATAPDAVERRIVSFPPAPSEKR
jgi:stage II sporulation protein D